MDNFGWYYRTLEDGNFSNVHAINVYTSNLQASNLGVAAFCNYAGPSSDGIITAADYNRWDAGGPGGSNFDTLTASSVFTSNIFASNLGTAAFTSANDYATPGDIVTASNLITSSLGSAAYTSANDYATPGDIVAASNAIAESLGSAAYQPVSTWIPSESNVLASAGATGFLSAVDWSRFDAGGGGGSLTTVTASLASQYSFVSAANVWVTNIPLSVSLSAGTWLLLCIVRGEISSASTFWNMAFRLWNMTTNAEVPNSLTGLLSDPQKTGTVPSFSILTTSGTETVRLEGLWWASSGTPLWRFFTGGLARITAIKIG
jgi:hypothetical protein